MGETCRLCLSKDDVQIPLFNGESSLPDQIKACLALQVSIDDYDDRYICCKCNERLKNWQDFKREIQIAQKLNSQHKILHLRTTSNAENQSSSNDSNKSGLSSSRFDSAACQFKNRVTHSFACESEQMNLCDRQKSDERGPIQVFDSVGKLVGSFDSTPSSHLNDSSLAGGKTFGDKPAALKKMTTHRRNSTQSVVRTSDQAADGCNEYRMFDPQLKRKSLAMTSDETSPSKSQKVNLDAIESTKGKNSFPPKQGCDSGPKLDREAGAESDSKTCPKPSGSKEGADQTKGGDTGQKYGDANRKKSLHAKVVKGENNIAFTCSVCRSSHSTLFALNKHKMKQHSNVTKEGKSGKWICGHCKRILTTSADWVLHDRYCGTDQSFICRVCSQEFGTKLGLKTHIGAKHREGNFTHPEQQSTAKSPWTCEQCKRSLENCTDIALHKRYCGTDSAFICTFCAQQFGNRNGLSSHIFQKHRRGNLHPDQQSTSFIEIRVPKSPEPSALNASCKESNTNTEFGKICSPAFMNEHLKAPKTVQVLVEKSPDDSAHDVGNLEAKTPAFNEPESTESSLKPAEKITYPFCGEFINPVELAASECGQEVQVKEEVKEEMVEEEWHLKSLEIHQTATPTESVINMTEKTYQSEEEVVDLDDARPHSNSLKYKVIVVRPARNEDSGVPASGSYANWSGAWSASTFNLLNFDEGPKVKDL